MTINIFEGGRRIAKLFAVLCVVGGLVLVGDGITKEDLSLGEVLGIAFLWCLASLGFLWGFTWTAGWVARGFMGIPRGRDSRE